MEKNVFITGITGFAGSNLAKKILEIRPNFRIFGLKRKGSSIEKIKDICGNIELFEGDITDRDSLDKAIKQSQPNYVFHLAALMPNPKVDDKLYWEINVNGTRNLLESIVNNANEIFMTHYASTGYVYGKSFNSGLPVNETAKTLPTETYEQTKLEGEKLFMKYSKQYDLPIVITRAFHHEGPGCREDLIGMIIIKKIFEFLNSNKKSLSFGNIKNVIDLTDVRDIVYGYLLAVEKGQFREVYNLCSGKGHSIEELINFTIKHVGIKKPVEITIDKKQVRPNEFPVRIGDYSKAKKELGWEPKLDFLKQTFPTMINFYLSNIKEVIE
jgi:GDP-4-dehydro-6-deoxy-D-mannose reductase